jgi:hypothetical protein
LLRMAPIDMKSVSNGFMAAPRGPQGYS